MDAMNARQLLTETGYIVLYRAVPVDFVDNLRAVALNDGMRWNNGTWDGDTQRPRARLPDPLSRILTTSFRRHYMTFFPHCTATEWSFWQTAAGARDKPVRRDVPPPQANAGAAELDILPGTLLVATQDDTVIYGYGWNRIIALRSNRQAIHLNKGDMILFRGDFIYSPAGYETNNLCVHGYLDTPFFPRELGKMNL